MICRVGPVILSYGPGGPANVRRLVDELLRDGVTPDCITVVHNPDGLGANLLAPPLPTVRVINAERNLGYAGGMNLGIRQQQEEGRSLFLLLTQDVRLNPGAVRHLVDAADRAPAYGVLGPKLRWEGRTTVFSYGGRWSGTGGSSLIIDRPGAVSDDNIAPCDYVDGAVVLLRSDVVDRVGPLTERFFMYCEEAELCLRAKRAGWKVGVVLDADAVQSSGEELRPGAFSYLMARNGLEFSRMVGGQRAVAAALGRDLARSWRLLKMRFSPKSDRRRQSFASASLIALWRGVGDYFRGRWGPPPANLRGLGDVSSGGAT
jgi:GT2 family glycosyltransferase